jgi:hypothetical protein
MAQKLPRRTHGVHTLRLSLLDTPVTMRWSSLRMALAAMPVVADLKSCWEKVQQVERAERTL